MLTAERKAALAESFLKSGLALRPFSRQHGICHMSLYRWVRKARAVEVANPPGQPGAIDFCEVKLPRVEQPSNWVAELALPNGSVLRISKEAPPSMIEQLLRVC